MGKEDGSAMPVISRLPVVIVLSRAELRQRSETLKYVSDRLQQPTWVKDPLIRQLLLRERDHVLDEIIQGRYLPFEWELA